MNCFRYALLLMLCCCQPHPKQIDLLVYNARVYTVDSTFSTASAFAVDQGRFVAVGDSARIFQYYRAQKILDAGGKPIVPGLFDAHCHFLSFGLTLEQVDLKKTRSYEEVVDRVRRFRENRDFRFIYGQGWDQNDWQEKKFPNKALLDQYFPDIPVVLERIDGHALLVNQKALDRAGIDAKTQVEGGEILKENGQLTGILIDNPKGLIERSMPHLGRNAKIEALKQAEEICLGYGLTTVDVAGLPPADIALIDSLQQAGTLKIRVYAMVSNTPENLELYLARGPYKTDRLQVCSFKVYADGALGSRGAALKEPYADRPGHFGAMVTPVDSIYDLATRLAASEFQMNTHAIGDSANAVVLRAYSRALEGKPGRRWRVEHAQIVAPEELQLFANGIIPSVQPTHATSDMYWAGERLGESRIAEAYAYKTLLQQAGRIALGTDFPVEEVNPFLTFYAAVTRKDLEGYPPGGFHPEEALSREETLRGMTIWAAYSNFEEAEKGSIEAGKWADFVILSNDLIQAPETTLPHIRAEAVYIGGEQVK